MPLVVHGEDSRYSRFNLPLLFISKGYCLKAHGISYYNSNAGYTCLTQKLKKNMKATFAYPSNNTDGKIEAFNAYMLNLLPEVNTQRNLVTKSFVKVEK